MSGCSVLGAEFSGSASGALLARSSSIYYYYVHWSKPSLTPRAVVRTYEMRGLIRDRVTTLLPATDKGILA